MPSLFNKIKGTGTPSTTPTAKDAPPKKNDITTEVTPLEKMLQNAGALTQDGRDRFLGFENFGNTCYCNSIVQALFHSDQFREGVLNYPSLSPTDTPNGPPYKPNVTIRPPVTPATPATPQKQPKLSTSQALKHRQALGAGPPIPGQPPIKPEDKPDTPEYKKKQAMLKGPILELAQESRVPYGMDECTFTGLKDIFMALTQSSSRTGVLSPQRFLEIFKRDNEMFQSSNHQDAHEFLRLVLTDVIASVDNHAKHIQDQVATNGSSESLHNGLSVGLGPGSSYNSPGTGWVHDVFEGVVTSETKCLTCETASQRDQTFLDLSIALDEHSSVTSCLRKFSAEEMLCERDKFQCDHCGGLQEAEKRMRVKKLPKVLTLHLNRFKYTEDYSRVQKLFHRVVYPYHLRMFHTADEAEDPDRLYELYAVIVHIGGNGYHGHYVSIIKTRDRGWLLFDDEMVEPVDKHFVRNFFGDRPGMATAYLLFYQETTFEKVRAEQEAEGKEEVRLATEAANIAHEESDKADETPLSRQQTQPIPVLAEQNQLSNLAHAKTAPDLTARPPLTNQASVPSTPAVPSTLTPAKSKDELKREKKEREAAEKAARQQEKEELKAKDKEIREYERKRRDQAISMIQAKRQEQEQLEKVMQASKKSAAKEDDARKKEEGNGGAFGFLDRSKRGSKSGSRKAFGLFSKDRNGDDAAGDVVVNGDAPEKEKTKSRLSIGLGRKKSTNLLS
ncbi:ubiquitin hydrolase CreB [Cordyceps fumosorosea ARSEF 2679]|uniref:Ubiquitin carboxyl-terminal hydrolase n=1 Tax=Cordyceps fumosorosea (strain ARSEF 2679) TaxID=1081104 RepID=A0A167XHD5_CORFA|nr:ubiquitin hydrolase CreB [Cordyceps fumosorosea ARSEF 2679]OAA64981.1 ubiquitin hydrolase CreB [Cordyceps fumosorosea ARSEF 2679]